LKLIRKVRLDNPEFITSENLEERKLGLKKHKSYVKN